MGGLRDRHPGRRGRRRHHDRRHAAQQHPADHARSTALRDQAEGRRRAAATSTSASGAARSPATSATCAALHDAGVFGFKCFLADSGVDEFPPLSADRARARTWPSSPASARMMIVHAEDGDALERAPTPHGRHVRRLPRLPAARRREPRDRGAHRGRPAHRGRACTCCTCPARTRCRCCARPGATGIADHRRDLPALPHLRGRGDPRRRHPVQVLPADPRGRQPRGRCGRRSAAATSTASSPTTRPCTPELKRLDARRLRHGLGRHLVAAARAARRVDRGAAARARARRRRRAGWRSAPPRSPGLARKGRIAPGCDADLVAFAPDAAFVVDPGRLHHRNPVTPYADRALAGVVRQHLAARRARSPTASRAAADPSRRERDELLLRTDRRAAAADPAAHRPGDVPGGLRGDPARHQLRHRHQLPAASGRAPGSGCWPGRCPASPRPSPST